MISFEKHDLLKAWPFQEALKIIKKNGGIKDFKIPKKGYQKIRSKAI